MAGPAPPVRSLELELLPESLAVCRLGPAEPLPDWLSVEEATASIVSVCRTAEELSVVCPERLVPASQPHQGGRRALRVSGTLDHSLTGILVAIAAPLAGAGVPVFAVSTWDTDYLLVAGEDLGRAVEALTAAGHNVAGAQGG